MDLRRGTGDSPRLPFLERLDNAAGKMNAYLFLLAIGLAVMNLTYLSLLGLRHIAPPNAQSTSAQATSGQATSGQIGIASPDVPIGVGMGG